MTVDHDLVLALERPNRLGKLAKRNVARAVEARRLPFPRFANVDDCDPFAIGKPRGEDRRVQRAYPGHPVVDGADESPAPSAEAPEEIGDFSAPGVFWPDGLIGSRIAGCKRKERSSS
jgi:hypothetical protein